LSTAFDVDPIATSEKLPKHGDFLLAYRDQVVVKIKVVSTW